MVISQRVPILYEAIHVYVWIRTLQLGALNGTFATLGSLFSSKITETKIIAGVSDFSSPI